MNRRAFLAGSLAAAAGAVCGAPGRAGAAGRWWSGLLFGVLENHGFNQVASLPSHRRLFSEGTVLTRYSAVAHPSGPNYRALASGATWGRGQVVNAFHPTIATRAAGATPPIPTYVYHLSGQIALRHNPFLDLRAPVAGVRHGLDALRSDLGGSLPETALVYVGWDDHNNMHDGDRARADQNLTALLDVLAASPWFTAPDRDGRYPALFVCYDEAADAVGNHVFAAWWGPGVRRGTPSSIPHTHFSFCRTVTDNWRLPPLAQAAAATAITEVWT